MNQLKSSKAIWISTLSLVLLFFQNCMSSHDAPPFVDLKSINTERVSAGAMAVLQNKCSGCHGPTSSPSHPPKDILDIDTLTKEGWIIPGSPQNSPLYTTIIDGEMPPSSKEGLSVTETNFIRDWIIVLGGGDPAASPNQNGNNNGGGTTTPPPSTTPNGTVLYNSYCSNCHGVGSASDKKRRTATQITNSINSVTAMASLKNVLSATQIQAIASYLATL